MSKVRSPNSSGSRTGALVGAVTRPMVVSAFWLFQENRAETWFTILTTSCLFGLLVGSITGRAAAYRSSLRHPWVGPLIGGLFGAVLSFTTSVVTLFFLCLATYQPRAAEVNIEFYWAVMTLVGALPGICGGLAANRARQRLAEPISDADFRPADGPFDPEA
ncbi:MAG: hypothetical protein ACLQVF_31025 [Isosphaeraceae bacterium]